MSDEQAPKDSANADKARLSDGDTPGADRSHEQRAGDVPHNMTPEAQRALVEAEERRRQQSQNETQRPAEVGGRNGPDPVRYGDWEKGGIASDF